jgi:hypothetical protein
VAKFELGAGLKFLVITMSVIVLIGLGFGAGKVYNKLGIEESNVEVMSNDSTEARKISDETRELKDETDEWLKHNDPYNSDGSPTDEWLQFIQSQESTAKQRGNQTSIIRKVTKM